MPWVIGCILLAGAAVIVCSLTYRRIPRFTTDELGDFAFDQVNGTLNDVPEAFRKLDGKRVVLKGEMWQPWYLPGSALNSFELTNVRDHHEWHAPKIQDFVQCHSLGSVQYTDGVVSVTGILHVNVVSTGGKVTGVFGLDAERIDPAHPIEPRTSWVLIPTVLVLIVLVIRFWKARLVLHCS
jgi:hypothetical protein